MQRLSRIELFRVMVILVGISGGLEFSHGRHHGRETEEPVERANGEMVESCSSVLDYFGSLKVSDHEIPQHRIYDSKLEVCNNDNNRRTCCTRPVEHALHQVAMDDVRDVIISTSSHLKSLLINNTRNYQDHFLKMLSLSMNKTLTMLLSIYRIPSRDAESVLDNLLTSFNGYISGNKELSIADSLSRFFDELFPSIFLYTINDHHAMNLTTEYRKCLSTSRQNIVPAPFGDAANKLVQDLVRSLGVARSLLDAFELATETVNFTEHFHFEHQCSRAITRLLRCSHCEGHLHVRPCKLFCINVANGCLTHVANIDGHWNLFVDAIEKLVSSMRGTHDIEDVLANFHSRLSNSLMHSMVNAHRYHTQVIGKCGSPNVLDKSPAMLNSTTRNQEHAIMPPLKLPEIKLHQKIDMFVRFLSSMKGFYRKLPDSVCNSEKLSAGDYDNCWNGTHLSSYTQDVPEMIFHKQITENPEMHISEAMPVELVQLTNKLDHMTKVLHSRVAPKVPMPTPMPTPMQSDFAGDGEGSGSGDDDGESGNGSGWESLIDKETEDPLESLEPKSTKKFDPITTTDLIFEETLSHSTSAQITTYFRTSTVLLTNRPNNSARNCRTTLLGTLLLSFVLALLRL